MRRTMLALVVFLSLLAPLATVRQADARVYAGGCGNPYYSGGTVRSNCQVYNNTSYPTSFQYKPCIRQHSPVTHSFIQERCWGSYGGPTSASAVYPTISVSACGAADYWYTSRVYYIQTGLTYYLSGGSATIAAGLC